VSGTKGDDDISLRRVDDKTVELTVNGETKTFNNVKAAKIDGKKGDDNVTLDPNLGINLDVRGGKGGDTISAVRDGVDAGDQDGGFKSFASGGKKPHVRIAGGQGDDEITSDLDYAKLLGGGGSDTIDNAGNDAKVRGGRGNDFLINHGIRADIRGGRGDDLVVNDGLGSTVRGNAGKDSVINDDPAARINGGRGDDVVQDNTGTAQVRSAAVVDDI